MAFLADAVYRLLLLAFPPDVRRAHGPDMLRQFRNERARVAGRPLAALAFCGRAFGDAIWYGVWDRLSPRPSVTRRSWRDLMHTSSSHLSSGAREASKFFGADTLQDMRYGVRRLLGNPGFTLVIVLTLALGIGANSAIFTVVHGVLFEPLPYEESSRLVGVYHVFHGDKATMSPPNFVDVQKTARSFDAIGAYVRSKYTLTDRGEPAELAGAQVSRAFFDVFRMAPTMGRTFAPDENEPGRTHAVVLSDLLWRGRFGGDPDVVNKTITLDGQPYTVVGIMPPAFAWPLRAQLWTPLEYDQNFISKNRGAWYLSSVARLRPGVDERTADAEVATIAKQLQQRYPEINTDLTFTTYPLLEALVGQARVALLVLLSAVAFVLLIACANVANLLLARAAVREDELAVRAALGAGRGRLIRQLLTESLVLAALGGAAGLALAWWGTQTLVAMRPTQIPRFENIHIDQTVVAFAAAATLLTGVLFGLLPAVHITRTALANTLRERGRSAPGGRRGQRLRSVLVVAEMGLAVLLLVGAGLLIRSFIRLSDVSPGFTVGQALTFGLSLPESKYKTEEQIVSFYARATERLAALPGVTSVGSINAMPPASFSFNLTFAVVGRPPDPPGREPSLQIRVADANYFQVMGIPLRKGRYLSAEDRPGGPPVMVLTESAVRQYFPGEDPIGKRVNFGWHIYDRRVTGMVIGVVGDVKSFSLDQDAPPQAYLPLTQVPVGSMAFVVRTAIAPTSLAAAVRDAVAALDPNLPVNNLETLETHVAASIAERRFYMLLLALFSGVALVLAAVGIFGVLSYLVTQRTREIGIRVALGARRSTVISLVLRQAIALSGIGVALGIAGALGLANVLRTLLFEMSPTDPMTFALVAVGLMAVAILAAYVPARRAVAVDPIIALRSE